MLKKFPQTKFLCVGALVWASHVHILALAWASRGHVLALAWASWCLGVGKLHALVPWRGHIGALVWQAAGTFCPWRGQATCTFWPWPCNVGLGKKKKKVARNFLKFCMEVYNPILSTSGKDVEKIPTNEVFMRWCLGVGKPRAHFGLGRTTLASEKKKKSCSEFSQILHGGL